MAERQADLDAVLRRVRVKILALRLLGISLDKLAEDNTTKKDKLNVSSNIMSTSVTKCGVVMRGIKGRVITSLRKSRGGGVKPPPPMSWNQVLLTFVGVFVTLLMITRLNVYVQEVYGFDYEIVLG